MTIEEGIDNYVQHDHCIYFPAGYCSSHSGLYLKGIPNEKCNFQQVSFDSPPWKRLYFCTIPAITTRLRKKHGISGTVQGLQCRWKKSRSIIYCESVEWSSSHFLCDSFASAPWPSRREQHFSKCSFLCHPGSLWGVPKPKFKDHFLKEFLPAGFQRSGDLISKQIKASCFSLIPWLRIFFGDGSILGISYRWTWEGEVVFNWMSSNSSSEQIFSWGVEPCLHRNATDSSLVQDDKKLI